MARKDILLPFGERTGTQVDIDELLKSKLSDKKRKEIDRDEEIAEAKHEATLAKLKKEVKTSEVAVEKAEDKKGADTGFKVTGGVNLGNIDLDAERKQATQDLKDLKKEQDETLKVVGRENEQLRDKIHEQEMKVLEISFKSQMEMLTKMIEGNASKGNFTDQLNAARTIAQELGYAQPSGASGDLMTQLKLKEMEFNQARELRKLSREEKEADRHWQLELRRMDDERLDRRAEQDRQAKKDDMFAKAPEVVGRAIGRAILEGGGIGRAILEGGGGTAEQPVEAPVTSKGKQPGIEAGISEAGEADCINCGKLVAIGPTARVAVCAGCGARYPIKRVKTEAAETQPQTAGTTATEEEE